MNNECYEDERENDNICVEQVIELACEIAYEQLLEYWTCLSIDSPMEIQKDNCIHYTDLAQETFNRFYDDVEGQIIEAMQTHPNKNIIGIKEFLYKN